MPHRRLSTRKTAEILRPKYEAGLANRQIARSCGVTHTTDANYLEGVRMPVWGGPRPWGCMGGLQALLFPDAVDGSRPSQVLPHMEHIHRQLRLTLRLLRKEYRSEYPCGHSHT